MFRLVILVAFLCLAAQARAQASYGPYPQETYVTCQPPATPSQVVVQIHGGGWAGGSDTGPEDAEICKLLAQDGVLVVAIDYRLDTVARWPAQLQDAQLAIRWARDQYNMSVCSLGTSAGAQMSLMLGASPLKVDAATDPANEAGEFSDLSSTPDCVVSWSAPTDLITLYGSPQVFADVKRYVSDLVGGETNHASLAGASPIRQPLSGMPPTMMLHGINDPLIPLSQATWFWAEMHASVRNAQSDVFIEDPGRHVLSGLTETEIEGYVQKIAQFVAGI